jgi:hypothetical protein
VLFAPENSCPVEANKEFYQKGYRIKLLIVIAPYSKKNVGNRFESQVCC